MNEKKITVETKGHVLLMGLNRPDKMNAFDVEMYLELAAAFGELDRERELRCGLLFAHGKHFTAGLELPKWAPFFSEAKFPDLPAGACDPFGLDESRRVGKPMVMAAQGICYTIGLELMLAMDIRVASSDTRFGQIEVRRGIYPVGGATVRLHQEIGWGNAMRYLLDGRRDPCRRGAAPRPRAGGDRAGPAVRPGPRDRGNDLEAGPPGCPGLACLGQAGPRGGRAGGHRPAAAGSGAHHGKRRCRRGHPVLRRAQGRPF